MKSKDKAALALRIVNLPPDQGLMLAAQLFCAGREEMAIAIAENIVQTYQAKKLVHAD